MEDYVNFKGHFTVQTINQYGDIVDEYVENNMIMEVARTSMAKIFAQLTGQDSISKIVLGTYGHNFTGADTTTNIIFPKTSEQGFVKERDRLFSEPLDVGDGDIAIDIKENDLVKYIGTINGTATTNAFYIWAGEDAEAINIATTDFGDSNLWKPMGTTEPYTYTISFGLPGTTSGNLTDIKEYGRIEYSDWDAATDYLQDAYVLYDGVYYISLSSSGNQGIEPTVTAGWESFWEVIDFFDSGSTGSMTLSDSSVSFTFDINTTAANDEDNVIYTEAALYTGADIFAMKTFKAKIKDSSVLLRIIWTITF
jgi:hypothetical protein